MMRSLRARVHLALNLEQRDELAGFWAVIFAAAAAIALWCIWAIALIP